MITQKRINELICPIIECDVCGGIIEKAEQGIVIFDPAEPHPSFVHKITCDSGEAAWTDLGVFLYRLIKNVRLDIDKAEASCNMLSQL